MNNKEELVSMWKKVFSLPQPNETPQAESVVLTEIEKQERARLELLLPKRAGTLKYQRELIKHAAVAIVNDNETTLKILLELGLDKNAVSEKEYDGNAIQFAAHNASPKCFKELLVNQASLIFPQDSSQSAFLRLLRNTKAPKVVKESMVSDMVHFDKNWVKNNPQQLVLYLRQSAAGAQDILKALFKTKQDLSTFLQEQSEEWIASWNNAIGTRPTSISNESIEWIGKAITLIPKESGVFQGAKPAFNLNFLWDNKTGEPTEMLVGSLWRAAQNQDKIDNLMGYIERGWVVDPLAPRWHPQNGRPRAGEWEIGAGLFLSSLTHAQQNFYVPLLQNEEMREKINELFLNPGAQSEVLGQWFTTAPAEVLFELGKYDVPVLDFRSEKNWNLLHFRMSEYNRNVTKELVEWIAKQGKYEMFYEKSVDGKMCFEVSNKNNYHIQKINKIKAYMDEAYKNGDFREVKKVMRETRPEKRVEHKTRRL